MNLEKEMMYKIATGRIENPSIELEIDGELQKFEGRDANLFAFGVLAGMKVERDGCDFDDSEVK